MVKGPAQILTHHHLFSLHLHCQWRSCQGSSPMIAGLNRRFEDSANLHPLPQTLHLDTQPPLLPLFPVPSHPSLPFWQNQIMGPSFALSCPMLHLVTQPGVKNSCPSGGPPDLSLSSLKLVLSSSFPNLVSQMHLPLAPSDGPKEWG